MTQAESKEEYETNGIGVMNIPTRFSPGQTSQEKEDEDQGVRQIYDLPLEGIGYKQQNKESTQIIRILEYQQSEIQEGGMGIPTNPVKDRRGSQKLEPSHLRLQPDLLKIKSLTHKSSSLRGVTGNKSNNSNTTPQEVKLEVLVPRIELNKQQVFDQIIESSQGSRTVKTEGGMVDSIDLRLWFIRVAAQLVRIQDP